MGKYGGSEITMSELPYNVFGVQSICLSKSEKQRIYISRFQYAFSEEEHLIDLLTWLLLVGETVCPGILDKVSKEMERYEI